MTVVRRLVGSVLGIALMIAVTACGPVLANGALSSGDHQTLSTVSAPPTLQRSGEVIWGRLPYCNCFAGSATANVAGALQEANLTVSLQELSPRDGWLYFAVTFDPHAATEEQVAAAMTAGGAQVLDGPP